MDEVLRNPKLGGLRDPPLGRFMGGRKGGMRFSAIQAWWSCGCLQRHFNGMVESLNELIHKSSLSGFLDLCKGNFMGRRMLRQ